MKTEDIIAHIDARLKAKHEKRFVEELDWGYTQWTWSLANGGTLTLKQYPSKTGFLVRFSFLSTSGGTIVWGSHAPEGPSFEDIEDIVETVLMLHGMQLRIE